MGRIWIPAIIPDRHGLLQRTSRPYETTEAQLRMLVSVTRRATARGQIDAFVRRFDHCNLRMTCPRNRFYSTWPVNHVYCATQDSSDRARDVVCIYPTLPLPPSFPLMLFPCYSVWANMSSFNASSACLSAALFPLTVVGKRVHNRQVRPAASIAGKFEVLEGHYQTK
ncbi:uncharacterized protein CLUP02_18249 [Colletotrichum lupini]|uniref:Uncharacterized protein n=1 Tax=Colletotrichum lupini TaxID=145971 RepID=A0A9Q8WB24_9PEZI|nr:uncharacterized protein CLUP02_18249 [Colletotrichum lupini]UQC76734.1 hypothetical protein CLUP02_18249 [Colletotrichum lupini]